MSEPGAATLSARAAVSAALEALEAQGARAFDEELCDCVRALLTRADVLGGGAAERLVARADSYRAELAHSFAREQARSAELLAALEVSRGPQPELSEKLARGELSELRRRVRRIRARPWLKAPQAGEAARVPRAQADGLARIAPTGGAKRPRAPKNLAYEDSVAEMVASFALARAVDVVPKDAGPYNPLRIASDLLDALRAVSPFFLTVQLNRLEELGSLLTLPDLPEKAPPPPAPSAKKKLPGRGKKR